MAQYTPQNIRHWQMLLNFGKCKCIHIGHGNMDEEYKMGVAVLGRTTQEKNLGVTFSADMKVSEQCGIAASKRNQIIWLVRRTIMYKEKQLIVPLYKAIVKPHLEYCIQAWRPYRKKDIDKLERIQRRATKMTVWDGHEKVIFLTEGDKLMEQTAK